MLLAGNVNGIVERQWSREKLCDDEVEPVMEIIYLGDRVSAGGEELRLLWLSQQDVGWLVLCKVPSCYTERDFIKTWKGVFTCGLVSFMQGA